MIREREETKKQGVMLLAPKMKFSLSAKDVVRHVQVCSDQ